MYQHGVQIVQLTGNYCIKVGYNCTKISAVKIQKTGFPATFCEWVYTWMEPQSLANFTPNFPTFHHVSQCSWALCRIWPWEWRPPARYTRNLTTFIGIVRHLHKGSAVTLYLHLIVLFQFCCFFCTFYIDQRNFVYDFQLKRQIKWHYLVGVTYSVIQRETLHLQTESDKVEGGIGS